MADNVDSFACGNKGSEFYVEKIEELDKMIDDFMGQPELHNSSPHVKSDLLKKRNALYSQRKYYRKKLKVGKLEQQRDFFAARNAKLRRENQIFEQMLVCAQKQAQIHDFIHQAAVAAPSSNSGGSSWQTGKDVSLLAPAVAMPFASAPQLTSSASLQRLLQQPQYASREQRLLAALNASDSKLPANSNGTLSAEIMREALMNQSQQLGSNQSHPCFEGSFTSGRMNGGTESRLSFNYPPNGNAGPVSAKALEALLLVKQAFGDSAPGAL